jgi:dihydroorotase-like cyclic amidohydrolase
MCPYRGYDDWVQRYPREDEICLVSDVINSLTDSPRTVHISGISCAESIELISEYYRAH